MPTLPEYQVAYDGLKKALKEAPTEQLALLAATDQLYKVLDESGEAISNEEYLDARMLLSQAEGILTRYFGM